MPNADLLRRAPFHPPPCAHVVQFYENPVELEDPVSSFVTNGLARGEVVILILSDIQRKRLRGLLRTPPGLGELVVHDARSVLDLLVVDGKPDARRFTQMVRRMFSPLRGRPTRLFGEAVNLLAGEGNFEGAILLEQLWNKFLAKRTFPLYCAYDVGVFCKRMKGTEYRHLRTLHDCVFPA